MSAELIAALDRLDALFSDETKWCKDAYAKLGDGSLRLYGGVDGAVQWCLIGGTEALRISPLLSEDVRESLAQTVGLHRGQLAGWNDERERTFADIKKLIADTRARLRGGKS